MKTNSWKSSGPLVGPKVSPLGNQQPPAERTAILSNDGDSVNQLSLYWRIMDQGVPAPDVGYFTRALSVILKLKVD